MPSATTAGNSMPIQLQPQITDLEAWVTLAQQENAVFEVMDSVLVTGSRDFGKLTEITETYRNTGLCRSLHGAFMDVNPASGDPDFSALSRQRCRESCETAVSLGAGDVVFHSSAFPFLRGAYLENWASGCAAFYEELAQNYPVRIWIENAQDLDPEPLRCLMDKVRSDRIGVCLDIGHASYSRTPVSAWFESLSDRIGYLHLSDNLGQFDDHLPLGQGRIDWEQVNGLWKALGREIPITLETGSLASAAGSLRFLREHRYFGLEG